MQGRGAYLLHCGPTLSAFVGVLGLLEAFLIAITCRGLAANPTSSGMPAGRHRSRAETTGCHHVLAGVSVTSGQVEVRRDIPTPDGHPASGQQRAALALANGRVYVAFGGLEGNCGPCRGSVVGVPTAGQGPLVSCIATTGRIQDHISPGSALPHLTSPSLSRDLALVDTLNGGCNHVGAKPRLRHNVTRGPVSPASRAPQQTFSG